VESVEELADTLLTFQHFPPFLGDNVAIIAGLAGGGGGESVSSTDACTSAGLNVPPFTDETRSKLKAILPPAGAIFRNPLDMGGVGGIPETLEKTMELVVSDPRINIIIVNENLESMVRFLPKGGLEAMNDIFIRFRKSQPKPLVIVSPPGVADADLLEVERKLSDAQVTVYPSLDRAAKAIANMNWYYRFHRATQ
jgi:acetyltransferase